MDSCTIECALSMMLMWRWAHVATWSEEERFGKARRALRRGGFQSSDPGGSAFPCRQASNHSDIEVNTED